MTGYDLTAKMRRTRRRQPLNATEQALFYELVALCNEDDWAEDFFVASAELCHNLKISENTLNKARERLIQVGLISYKSGKSKRQYSQYSLLTVSKFNTNVGTNQSTNVGTNQSTNVNKNVRTNIKHKNQTKPNQTKNSKSHSETDVSVIEKIENLKSEIPKPPEDLFYKKFVSVWFEFYKKQFSVKPTYGALEGNKIKSILKKLKLKCEEFQMDWNLESAGESFKQFLEVAITDKWLKENFQLAILDSKFDSIIVKALKNNGNQTTITDVFANW